MTGWQGWAGLQFAGGQERPRQLLPVLRLTWDSSLWHLLLVQLLLFYDSYGVFYSMPIILGIQLTHAGGKQRGRRWVQSSLLKRGFIEF